MEGLSQESLDSIDGVEDIVQHDRPATPTNPDRFDLRLAIDDNNSKKAGNSIGSRAGSLEVATPLPVLGMSLMSAIQLNEALMINVLYPFLVFMTESFGYTGTALAGLLTALAGLLTAFF